MVHVLGRQWLHRLSGEIMAVLARRHRGEVAAGTGVQRQGGFQAVFVQCFGLGCEQILKNAPLEGQQGFAKQRRIQRRELVEHWVLARGGAAAPALLALLSATRTALSAPFSIALTTTVLLWSLDGICWRCWPFLGDALHFLSNSRRVHSKDFWGGGIGNVGCHESAVNKANKRPATRRP